jgi:hypothetical protein
LIKAIIQDHKKYVTCTKVRGGYTCIARGQTNDVRKTINEFLESIIYLERVSRSLGARVG